MFEKGLVYQGYKVMPYSTACNTPLSNFEAGLNYKDVRDPAVTVAFPVDGPAGSPHVGARIVAWTTTPWTLPSNLALCVNAEFEYVKVKSKADGEVYLVAESRLSQLFPAMASKKFKKGMEKDVYELVSKHKGQELVGLTYVPLFDYFASRKSPTGAFRVVCDGYVTSDSGTGVVHQAPAFGEVRTAKGARARPRPSTFLSRHSQILSAPSPWAVRSRLIWESQPPKRRD